MKQETRKLISGLIAAALMTSIFTGCSKQEESSIPFSSTSVVSDVETPTGETKLYRDETLDMRYKHWYDNPEVTSNDEVKYDDIWQTRDPETGRLQLDGVENDIAKISEDLIPSSAYEDYVKDTSLAAFIEDTDYKVFLNNVDTGDTFSISDLVMPVSEWLSVQHIAHFSSVETPTLHIATAAGQDAITFEEISDPDDDFDGGWLVKYLDGGFEQSAAASEVVISGEILNLTPQAVETILGLKIFVNDEHKVINIITDNKDLADSNSVIDDATPLEPEPEPTPEQPSTGDEPTTSGNEEPTQPTQPTNPTTPTTPTQPTQPTTQTKPKTPTDTTGMKLDENGFPAEPTRNQTFVDKNGVEWGFQRGVGWKEVIPGPAQGSVSTGDYTEEQWNHKVGY